MRSLDRRYIFTVEEGLKEQAVFKRKEPKSLFRLQGSIKLGIIAFAFPFQLTPVADPSVYSYRHWVSPLMSSLAHWHDREHALMKLLVKKDKEIDDLREMLDERGHKLKKSLDFFYISCCCC